MTLAEDGAPDCAKSEAMPDRERVKAPARKRNKKEKVKKDERKTPKVSPILGATEIALRFLLIPSASASRVPVNEHSVFFFMGASWPRIPKTRQLQ